MRELASDLVKKAKEIDALIEVLPGIEQTEDEQVMHIPLSFLQGISNQFLDWPFKVSWTR